MQIIKAVFILSILFTACKREEVDPNAIIDKAIAAYGGEENLRDIQTKHEIGTTIIYLHDTVFKTTRYQQYFKSPQKSYYESPINRALISKKLIFASNGEYAWTQNDGAMAPYMQPKSERIDRQGEDYPYLFTLAERGISIDYIDFIEDDNRKLHQLKYTSEGGYEEDVYFDDETGLIAKTYKVIQTSIGPAEVTQLYDDYRNVGGVMIPFRVESQYPPREVDLNIINHLQINKQVADRIFDFPEPPKLSGEKINSLVGKYSASSSSLEILSKNGDLNVKMNNSEELPLLIVNQDFFMFRIGEDAKSHIENISLISPNTLRLFYKDRSEVLTKK